MTYTFFDHTGDIGVDLKADSCEELFADAARALAEAMADTRGVVNRVDREIKADGEDRAEVLNRFLSALLVIFDEERLLLPSVRIERLTERFVHATASGEKYDPRRHEGRTELKAVTWHELRVEKSSIGWEGRVVFDV